MPGQSALPTRHDEAALGRERQSPGLMRPPAARAERLAQRFCALDGQLLCRRVTREDNLAPRRLLEQTIAIDPNYAQALAVLAVSDTFGAHTGWEDAAAATPVAELRAVRADGEDPWLVWRWPVPTRTWAVSKIRREAERAHDLEAFRRAGLD
jgi:hypothetical protein